MEGRVAAGGMKKKTDRGGRELDIAIKQAANLTNWRLNFFFAMPPPGVAAALKTSRRRSCGRGTERAARAKSGCSRGAEKKSIGVPLFASISLRGVPARKNEGRRGELCAAPRDAAGEAELREFEIVGERV